jgi:hypothetical protein
MVIFSTLFNIDVSDVHEIKQVIIIVNFKGVGFHYNNIYEKCHDFKPGSAFSNTIFSKDVELGPTSTFFSTLAQLLG